MNNHCLSTAPVANLQRRASLAKQLRAFFDSRGFTEVQTPVLSRYCVIDRHLDPIRIPASNVAIPAQRNSDFKGAKLEAGLREARLEYRYQFERVGYFCLDSKDSKPDALVFNMTVSLPSGH